MKVKSTLFENLDEIYKPGAILATTTSSLPIIALATVTGPRTSSGCTLQPGADHATGRGRLHVATADEVGETVRAVRQGRQARRLVR